MLNSYEQAKKILEKLKSESKPAILDIGSSIRRRGTITLDKLPLQGVDLICDILKGIPFPNDSIDEVIIFHVLEHLPVDSFEFVFTEIWRICKNKSIVHIKVPHFSCGQQVWSDPTHIRPFGLRTFSEYLCSDQTMHFNSNFPQLPAFESVSVTLHYYCFREDRTVRLKSASKMIDWAINFNPWVQRQFERRLAYFLGGVEEVDAKLKIIK